MSRPYAKVGVPTSVSGTASGPARVSRVKYWHHLPSVTCYRKLRVGCSASFTTCSSCVSLTSLSRRCSHASLVAFHHLLRLVGSLICGYPSLVIACRGLLRNTTCHGWIFACFGVFQTVCSANTCYFVGRPLTEMSPPVTVGWIMLSCLHPNLTSFFVLCCTFAFVMAATMEMQSIFLEFGVGTKVREYTHGLEVRTQHVFARFAATEDDLRTRLIDPYLAKLTDPNPATKALVEAAVLAARDAANVLRTTAAAATKPPFLLVTTIAAQPPSFAASIPSSLRPHQLAQQTAKYENPWTPPRTFPVKILLGADCASASPHSRPLRAGITRRATRRVRNRSASPWEQSPK